MFASGYHSVPVLLLGSVLLVWMGLTTVVLPGAAGAAAGGGLTAEDAVAQAIRMRLESGGQPAVLNLAREPILARSAVPDFYLQRFFAPAWTIDARPTAEAGEFLDILARIDAEGLDPEHYHLQVLENLRERIERTERQAELLADFDLLLTDAFLLLASHLQNGHINPETIDPEWQARRADFDPVPVLNHGLASGQVAQALSNQLPVAPEYAGLRQALAQYRLIQAAGGWPELPQDLKLRPGQEHPAVPLLRRRLQMIGDFRENAREEFNETGYDPPLVEAVQRFQQRHGLAADGVVGTNTLAALNVTARERVRQIEVNLERWRWLPRDLGERHLLVNIAAFELVFHDPGNPPLDMRVVVGKPYRRTPVFSGLMTYLVLNPYWHVPMSITRRDLLPQVRQDPDFLARMGFRVFRGWGSEATEIDPAGIDWAGLSGKEFPYHLRQEPGPANALGRIKFMFPNKYDIYLHDTPARDLFHKDNRTFSSGCIRIEKPLELARQLLAGTPFAAGTELERALAEKSSLSVKLPAPVPVHLLYWTAWVDDENTLHLRRDIYGRDRLLAQALDAAPP